MFLPFWRKKRRFDWVVCCCFNLSVLCNFFTVFWWLSKTVLICNIHGEIPSAFGTGKGSTLWEKKLLGMLGSELVKPGPCPGILGKCTHPRSPLLRCRVTPGWALLDLKFWKKETAILVVLCCLPRWEGSRGTHMSPLGLDQLWPHTKGRWSDPKLSNWSLSVLPGVAVA